MNEEEIRLWLLRQGAVGIVDPADVPNFRASTLRVFELLTDLDWHDANEIRSVAGRNGQPASAGLERVRELRGLLKPIGMAIEKQRKCGNLWEYRIARQSNEELDRYILAMEASEGFLLFFTGPESSMTIQPLNAMVFTLEEAREVANRPGRWLIWPLRYIEEHSIRVVNSAHVDVRHAINRFGGNGHNGEQRELF